MKSPHLLASTLALIGWTICAHAQSSLGRPVVAENAVPPVASTLASSSECSPSFRRRPLLGNLVRRILMPAHQGPAPAPAAPSVPTREDVARMIADGGYSPAEITAAKIRMDDAQAVHRQAAVRYLGTVDCLYYPEAELGLLAALRADRSEGVRHEAALAIANGRGTTQRLLEALHLSAQGSDVDGNPGETSERVRAAARAALFRLMPTTPSHVPPITPMTAMMPTLPPMPMAEWWQPDPFFFQPTNYFMPMPMANSTPTFAPVTPKERELAKTISTAREFTPPPPQEPNRERTIFHFLNRLRHGWPWSAPTDAGQGDPRLRGLAPLGSELALPNPATGD
ncbi:MAG: hypothetical protein HYX68_25590 [Planctomycetes bacterium]|nr:hypothetical protein [Planctomycetota bacterium]